MGNVHTKKSYPEFFEQVLSGDKTFDVRIADFECKPGDILEQIEIDRNGKPTGRTVRKKIGVVLKTKDIEELGWWPSKDVERYGFQVISLLEEDGR